jgi:processing peptidase subunit beta
MRDDEMSNLNIGVFFDAPTVRDPDYFAMKVFEKIMGEY